MSIKKYHKDKNISVGERIKKIRGNLTQSDFGKIIGVEPPSISRYESGRIPDITTLEKIADYGKTTIEWLLRGERQVDNARSIQLRLGTPAVPARPATNQAQDAPQKFEEKLLFDIILLVEECLEDNNISMTPAQKASLILLVHKKYRGLSIPVTKPTIMSFIEVYI